MENSEVEFNLEKINEESKANTKTFLSRKHLLSKNINFDEFEDGLNVSDIENKEENFKNPKNYDDSFNDFSEDLDNFNRSEPNSTARKISMESIDLEFNYKENKKKKIEREDLNNIPLPIFDCIYCTNEKIVFNNFIKNILADKYLLLSSVYDINDLNEIIENYNLINKKLENKKILNLMIKNKEYLNNYAPKEESKKFFKSNFFNNLCEKSEFETIKIANKKNSIYSRNYNSRNTDVYSTNDNNFKNKYNNTSYLNNSINYNSFNLYKNEPNLDNVKEKNNKFDYILDYIITKDNNPSLFENKDEIIEDNARKIRKEDIIWDEKCYDINNPDISYEVEEEISKIGKDKNYDCNNQNNVNIKKINFIRSNLRQFNNNFKKCNLFNNEKKNSYNINDKCNGNKSFLNLNCFRGVNIINNNFHFNYINKDFFLDMNPSKFDSDLSNDYTENNDKNINKNFFFNNIFKLMDKTTKKNKSLRMTSLQNNTNNNSTNYSIDTSSNSHLIRNNSIKSHNIKQKNSCNIYYLKDKYIMNYKYKNPKISKKKKNSKRRKLSNYIHNIKFKYFNINKENLNANFNNHCKKGKNKNIISKIKTKIINKILFHSKGKKQKFYNKNKEINSNIFYTSNFSFIINKNSNNNFYKKKNISYRNSYNRHINSSNCTIYNHIEEINYKKTYYYFREKKKTQNEFYLNTNKNYVFYYN